MRAPRAIALLGIAACAGAPRAVELDPARLVARGKAALAAGDPTSARADFEAALRKEPSLFAAVRGRIEAAARQGVLPAVEAEAEARCLLHPDDGLGWYAFGIARSAGGNGASATAALRRAADLLPGDADPAMRAGISLLEAGDCSEAIPLFRRALDLDRRDPAVRLPFAACLARLGDTAAALSMLAEVPALAPHSPEAIRAALQARTLTDFFRDVIPEARRDLDEGVEHLAQDSPQLALAALERLVEKWPELAPAHAFLGLAAAAVEQMPRAYTELSRAAALAPRSSQPHLYRAELFLSARRWEKADEAFGEALRRNPLDANALRRLGMLRLEQKREPAAALAPLRLAAALVGADDRVQILLARAELEDGRGAEGATRLEDLAKRRPDDADVLLELARALIRAREGASMAARAKLAERVRGLARRVQDLQPRSAAPEQLLAALADG